MNLVPFFFPLPVECQILDCLSAKSPVVRTRAAAWMDEKTKTKMCSRCKVRLDGIDSFAVEPHTSLYEPHYRYAPKKDKPDETPD